MAVNDKRKANIEKYREVLGAIGRSNKLPGAPEGHEIDMGVAYDMLCEMAKKDDYTIYAGVPADFNKEEFKQDAGL